MGQFRHEAAVVHAKTGNVYLTEDREPEAGFYRYVPKKPGQLAAGGRLEMMKVDGDRDLRGGFARGTTWKTSWVPIDDPARANSPGTRDGLGVISQGKAGGGAIFTRLEGAYANGDAVYFIATNGGIGACGQVFAYYPDAGTLTLVVESDSQDILDYPDNVCFSPRGGLVLCEDGDRRGMLIQGLSAHGELFPLVRNNVVLDGSPNGIVGDYRAGEMAGACFSPDGKWLFANVYHPGFTVAITGPWQEGLV
jgi:secreted PhoX family phosphatase